MFKLRIIIITIALSALVGLFLWYGSSKYNAGFKAAEIAHSEALRKAVADKARKLADEHQKVLLQRDKEKAETLKLIAELQQREPEVIEREIIKYVNGAKCRDLGPDFVELFNKIHR